MPEAPGVVPQILKYEIGQTGAAADVEGLPALLLAQQPDSAIDAGIIGPLTIRAASIRGAGHRYDGTPRQDDFALALAGPAGEWLIAIVADGVSAGPRSHIASRVVVRVGVQLISDALAVGPPEAIDWDQLIGALAGHILIQARRDAGDESLDARHAAHLMASTAAIVILPVEPDGAGVRRATVVPIGDTSVWVLDVGRAWQSVTHIKNEGEDVASSATFALPLLPATSIVPLALDLLPDEVLFAVTDGIGDPLGAGGGEVAHAFATAWATPPNRFEFAAQVDFNRRSHTDDRTVIGIWQNPQPPEPPPPLVPPDTPPTSLNLAPPPPAPPRPAPLVEADQLESLPPTPPESPE